MNSRNLFKAIIPATFILLATACDKHPDILGTWTATPTRINNISAAADAMSTMSISFTYSPEGQTDHGQVIISSLIDANQPVSPTDPAVDEAYEVSVAATAVISGDWTYEDHDDDDILLFLNPATLQINVDPSGVTFSNNILTQRQQPEIDSLSAVTAQLWKASIAKAMKQQFSGVQKISDIKIRNGIMSCEIEDRDFTFRKSGE